MILIKLTSQRPASHIIVISGQNYRLQPPWFYSNFILANIFIQCNNNNRQNHFLHKTLVNFI